MSEAQSVKKIKKMPERRCIGCMESFNKKDLIRVVRSSEGEVSLDFTGKKSGRGAYICKKTECFKKAKKAGRFSKNLNCDVPEEIYVKLEAELEEYDKK
ncbi:MAG: YlxR family protein [Ruminococcaceae bacterium]|nr:YlxR family protein [Oscillospiraceae bacterium]